MGGGQLQRERDLYRRLLELGAEQEIEPFLGEALALVTETAGARRGYLELRRDAASADEREAADCQVYWIARGCSDERVDEIRRVISRGIIAEAIATGRAVATTSAVTDPRFAERASVRAGPIEAVLCAPIGQDPPLGVVYLEGRAEPGPWTEEDRDLADLFARHLGPPAERLLARREARERVDATRALREGLRLEGVIGRSAALADALRQAALVAPLDVHVLLTGGSGTGKSQLARVIHNNGPRAAGPFVDLNCAAIPEMLVESELFGALKGSHSMAHQSTTGKVGAAQGGTLFLDEITELPLVAQSKLLQLMQSREYYPLGATRPEQADARIIAATNMDLERAVADKRFREDLFFRLQVLPIRMPSLAERAEDVPELAAHFCAQACERHRLARVGLSPAALRAVEAAAWPGNVRQLAHAIEAAAIRAAGEGAEQIAPHHVLPASARASAAADGALSFQEATRRFQAELLRKVLDEASWNVSEAARRLDLTRSHVYNLIRAFGFTRSG